MVLHATLLLVTHLPSQIAPTPSFEARLEAAFTASKVPGAAVAVFKDGKTVFQKAYGLANEERKEPMRTDHAFEIGSLSKQFVAVALLMLVKDRKISLDEKIGDLVPDLPEAWRAATLDQILHHMSGIPDYEEIATYDFYNLPRTPKEVIDVAASKPPAFRPGERFEYSNTGYFLLSLAFERRSGQPLGRFLNEKLFRPLGMGSSYAEPPGSRGRIATGYHSRTGRRVAQPPIAWTSTLGAGGIVSTLDDLRKWDASLYTSRLLPYELRAKLWQPTKTTGGQPVNYGYGWFTTDFRGHRRQDHSGQTNGFTCFYLRFPDRRSSVISFANTYGGGVLDLAMRSLVHFEPALGYASLPVPTDPDPERTSRHLAVAKVVATGQGDLNLLSPQVRAFIGRPGTEGRRERLRRYLDDPAPLRFVRRSVGRGGESEEFLYRKDLPTGPSFLMLRIAQEQLLDIRIEED